MKIMAITFALFITSLCFADPSIQLKPYEFKADDGTKVAAELGELSVPENRATKSGRKIILRFVRFKSTSSKPGYPIVYLAGGPGGSGIAAARSARFPLFMGMRETGDVIALDQRGVGMSEPDLQCKESYLLPFDQTLDPIVSGKIFAAAAKQCFDRHRAAGIDLSAYNTRESAADLNDLRIALGASKIRLCGISYGTHLALAAMKYFGEFIHQAVLAGVEPLNHTLKLPSDQEYLLQQIGELAAKDEKIRKALPDLMKSVGRLLKELETSPKSVRLTHPLNGMTAEVKLGKFDLQVALTDMLTGPESFSGMADLVSRLEQGDWTALGLLSGQRRMGQSANAMSIAMDCASGAEQDWLNQIRAEAEHTTLEDAINFPFPQICEQLGIPDLGSEFRSPFYSEIPVLMISGTLDGRTPHRNAKAAASHLKNVQHLLLEGAGHSDPLFLSSPKIADAMKSFFNGNKSGENKIAVDVPPMIPPRKILALAEETLGRFTGTYQINENESRKVIQAGDLLYTRRGEGNPLPVRPMSDSTFFYEGSSSWLRFESDKEGNVIGMRVFQQGREPGEYSKKLEEPATGKQSPARTEIEKSVEVYLENYLKAGFFSGSILIARKGEILLKKAYGLANHQFQTPNSPETKFHIASVSKSFTSAAIMILREKQLLSLTDPLTKYIPDYPNGDKIQIHHLLGHKSGIPNVNDFPDYDEKARSPQSLENIIQWFKNKPLEMQPGEKYSYSNSNYNLLAYIMEKVSGQSYGEFLREHIFLPLKMKDTAHHGDAAEIVVNSASGYVPVWINEFENAPYLDWSIKTGNGSLYSTVDDLYLWDRALYTEQVLPRKAIDEISQNQYGWFAGERFGRKRIYMNGRSPGFNSYMERYTHDDVTIILLCNQYTGVAHGMIADIAAIVFGEKYQNPPPFRNFAENTLQKNAGEYEFGSDFYRPGVVNVFVENGKLKAGWDQYTAALIPVTETEYVLLAFGARIEFIRDKNGNATEMVYRDSQEFRAKRKR